MTSRETAAVLAASFGAALVIVAASFAGGWPAGCAVGGVLLLALAYLLGVGDPASDGPPPGYYDDAGQPPDVAVRRVEGIGEGFR